MVINGFKMDKIYNDIEKLDQYLKGRLNETEKEELQARLAEDEDFRVQLDDMELMTEGIRRTASRTSLEEKLAKLDSSEMDEEDESERTLANEVDVGVEYEVKETKIVKLWYQRPIVHAIAASVTLIIVTFFVFGPVEQPTPKQLFSENFEAYKNLVGPKRGLEEDVIARSEAYAAYDLGDFSQAAMLLEGLVAESEDSDNKLIDQFYLGNAYLAIEEPNKAIKVLEVLAEDGRGLSTQAKWYLGLAYLLKGDVENAKKLFEQFQAEGGENFNKVEKVMDVLK